nr:hypothetical protein [Candidatus Eremiobacteraeota bacterium]
MTARTRLLSAALVVGVAALAGATYAGHAAAADTTRSIVLGSGQRIVGLDLATLLGRGDQQKQLVELAYERVEHAYYKPVADQLLIAGEHKALTAFLKSRKVNDPQVPRNTATGERGRDIAILENTLTSVQTRYAKLAPR